MPHRELRPAAARRALYADAVNDSAALSSLSRAYSAFERRASDWLSRYEARGGRVYCAAGCFHCCDMPIRTNLLEALAVAGSLDAARMAGMRAHARKVRANARAGDPDTYAERHREQVGFCPLLDREAGTCTAYAVRPTRCRDTYSALPAHYCAAGTWEGMSRRERAEYARTVERTPGTDGDTHYLAPVEDLSLPVWDTGARLMRELWGVEVWGDFAVLVDLTQQDAFWQALEARRPRAVVRALKAAGLYAEDIVEVL